MATIATSAMRRFAADWEAAIDAAAGRGDAAAVSGIVGDLAHKAAGGYHISREDQPASNYSCQLPEDREGASNWASAVDMSMRPDQMKLVTGRLLASARDQNDPRLNVCREFYGTLDGATVVGWDTYFGVSAMSDNSHLWHVHISFLRKHADDPAAMAAVLSVITGQPWGDDMEQSERLTAKTGYGARTVGDLLGDLSNLRDWLIGGAPSPIAPGGPAVAPTSPLGRILAAAEAPPQSVTLTVEQVEAMARILIQPVSERLAGLLLDEIARRMQS